MSYSEQAQAVVEGAASAHDDFRTVYTKNDIRVPFRKPHNVIIVSGDGYVRQCISRALSVPGIAAVVFESAAAYLACDRTSAAACIVLDVVLPDMCGLDLQRQLAGTCPPIIFATRRAEIAFSVRAMKEGAFDFLAVPFGPQELLLSVNEAIEFDRISRLQREELIGMRGRFERLTPRERQVMRLIVQGMPNKRAAHHLGISEVTVQIHRGRIKQKLELKSLAALVGVAVRLGIAPADVSRPVLDAPQNASRTPTLKYGPTLSYGTPLKKLDSILL